MSAAEFDAADVVEARLEEELLDDAYEWEAVPEPVEPPAPAEPAPQPRPGTMPLCASTAIPCGLAVGYPVTTDEFSELAGLAWIIHDFAGEKRKGALKD